MKFFKRKKETGINAVGVHTAPKTAARHPFVQICGYMPLADSELKMYSSLREAVPIIDAALSKLVRLLGGFRIVSADAQLERAANRFLKNVKVNGTSSGINSFLSAYTDQLLTYGTAVGEIVLTPENDEIAFLYNASLDAVEIKPAENGVDPIICARGLGESMPVLNQQLICCTLLNPEAGTLRGSSLLKGLPFVSEILLKIFQSVGNNWERVGNVRFAVTYRPNGDNAAYSQENAQQIAEEWSKAMRDKSRTCDFVSVGDVDIKVIGADNQVLDSEIPVRQLLEQITAKLGVPPFLLGLSWSSTERMSAQQADILTSEIDFYRRTLEPAIMRICAVWQRLSGFDGEMEIEWDNVSLQDETELALARLRNAQAQALETENAESEGKI